MKIKAYAYVNKFVIKLNFFSIYFNDNLCGFFWVLIHFVYYNIIFLYLFHYLRIIHII